MSALTPYGIDRNAEYNELAECCRLKAGGIQPGTPA